MPYSENRIKSENRVFIKADKSNNHYKMEGNKYKQLVEKEVQKEYKKATKRELENVEKSHKNIVSKLELQDKVFETTQLQCFARGNDRCCRGQCVPHH